MEATDVFKKVKEIIVDSCGIEEDKITPDSTIFDELGIDSIDMIDIMYNLEAEYDVPLVIGDFNKEASKEMGGEPYEVDNVITPKGLEVLRKRFPEISEEKMQHGLSMFEFVKLIKVQSLCNLVIQKIKSKED